MSYVRLDDSFAQHPKVVGLSDRAFRAQVTAMCYSGFYGTDGAIPKGVTTLKIASELVKAGLWEPMANGWQLHDWKDWNLTAKQWQERKQARSKAGSKGAAKRWANSSPDPEPDPKDLEPKIKSSTATKPRIYSVEFEAFWAVYPEKKDKGHAAKAFVAALDRAPPHVLIEGAQAYAAELRAHPDRSAKYAEGWLNGDRWLDVPSSNGQVLSERERFLASLEKNPP